MRLKQAIYKTPVVNWKTSLGGLVAFAAVLFGELNLWFDGVEATVPDWNLVVAAAAALVVALQARDGDKSTEQQA